MLKPILPFFFGPSAGWRCYDTQASNINAELHLKNRGNPGSKEPLIIPRAAHNVTRGEFSKSALKVLYRLHKAGYQAFLVGGCVRDAMLELHPKDFDVATNATPDEVRALFGNCRLIGRRFRLAHVRFGREIIEVATFRAAAVTMNRLPVTKPVTRASLAERMTSR